MKKYISLIVLTTLVSCSSSIEEDTQQDAAPDEIVTTVAQTQNNNSSTTTSINESYTFDNEFMSPFTGKELPRDIWFKRPRRVLAFKIDNNLNARPQSGIQEADSIFEILVEGGMTRFLAFFYDKTSDYLGPVRSARPTDPTLVRPYGGVLIVSGATPGLVPEIRDLGVPVLEEQSEPAMFRIESRSAPHNLYSDTELVRGIIDTRGFPFNPPPGPIYSFGNNQDNWSSDANRVIVKYSDFTTVVWKLDGDQYARFIIDGYLESDEALAHNFITRDGYTDIIKSESIAIIQGPIYIDEATTLPSVLTVGVGPVYIFNNGRYIEGTWRRNDISEPFDFYDMNQNPIYVPPSTQWVHILPLDGTVTWSNS